MRPVFHHLPEEVSRPFRGYYARRQRNARRHILLSGLLLYVLLLLLGMHVDRLLFLSVSMRWAMLCAVHVMTAVFLAGRFVLHLRRRPSVQRLAYEIESRLPPAVEERLVTLENVLAGGSPDVASPVAQHLLTVLQESAGAQARSVNPARLAKDPRLRRLGIVAGGLLALCLLLFLPAGYQFALMLARFYQPGRSLPKPSFVQVVVTPAEVMVGKGEDVVIQARISGRIPPGLAWLYRKLGVSAEQCVISTRPGRGRFDFAAGQRVDMSRADRDLFLLSRSNLQESFGFVIRCGDAETAVHPVEVVEQPRIVSATLTVTPPVYAGLPPATISKFDLPLRLLPGSTAHLQFQCNQDVTKRSIRIDRTSEPVAPAWDSKTRTGTWEFQVKGKSAFEVTVVNAQGFANRDRFRVVIDLLEDADPSVRLLYPASSIERVSGEIIPIQAEATDDFGVKAAAIRYLRNPSASREEEPQELPITLASAPVREAHISSRLDLENTGAVPGDTLVLQLRVRDTAGHDGFSQEVSVRIVPFTRDENERMRLRALRFLTGALTRVASAGSPAAATGQPDVMALTPEIYGDITRMAREAGVALDGDASLESLLHLLEFEQHFTDASRNKEDVRRIRAVLMSIGLPLTGDSAAEAWRSRAERVRPLAESVLPDLCRYRQLKNLTWRLFGMRAETERIRGRLGGPSAGDAGDEALDRRTRLCLDTLQDIGSELIDLSRGTRALDHDGIARTVGEINSAAYLLRRGNLPRRQASALEVQRLITLLLTKLRPAFLPLLEEQVQARAQLDRLYRDSLQRIADGPGPKEELDGWLARATRWLEADRRLMGRDPFFPLWPRFARFVMLRGVSAVGTLPDPARRQTAEAERHRPARDLAGAEQGGVTAVQQEGQAFARLAWLWEERALLAEPSLPNTEKALGFILLRREEALAAGAAVAGLPDPAALDPGRELTDEQLRTFVPPALTSTDAASQAVGKDTLPVDLPALAALAERSFRFPAPEEELKATVSFLREHDASIGPAGAGTGPDPASAPREIDRFRRLLAAETERVAGFADAVQFALLFFPREADAGEAKDLLLLRVRDALSRYRVAAEQPLQSLGAAGAAKSGAAELARVKADMDRLRILRAGLVEALAKLSAGDAQDSAQVKARYPLLREYSRTRRYVETTAVLCAGKGAAGTVEEFMQDFPEIARSYLVSRQGATVAAVDDLAGAVQALRAAPPDQQLFRSRLRQAQDQVRQLQTAAQRAGKGDLQARVLTEAGELVQAMDRLSSGTAMNAVEIKRVLFATEGIVQQLQALSRTLSDAGVGRDNEAADPVGGPEGLWNEDRRVDAERTRDRLVAQMAMARAQVARGVLEALNPAPDTGAYREGHLWALYLYRVTRSDLCTGGGIRLGRAAGAETGDPRLKFLREELEKARKARVSGAYVDVIRQYLDAVRDFLRY